MSRFPSGVDGEQMHSVFGLRYQHAIWKQFIDRGRPTYSLVRSSGALAAPYPFVLYSDLYNHREFIRALVNSGFSGLLWCPEVRDASSEEDLVRRLQSVVFSPLAMVNAWYIKNPPWKQIDRIKNNAGEFASGWETLEARCRTTIGWRMQLVPYLRSAFAQYAADGTPPFRALILDHPDDASLAMVDDEYMIGDRMLVAPLFAGESERKITLPRGVWHNFWTGETIQGGTSFVVPSSTDNIPVYVKTGSVLPVAAIADSTEAEPSKEWTVRVYGDGSLPWKLLEKSGLEMELRWDGAAQRGVVKQSQSVGRDLKISGWQKMS
jgi:alpha-D-xyloside xylohydrolase